MSTVQIVWLRRDLRLSDQPAFQAAAAQGPVIPVYILDDETAGDRRMGAASRWYLHQSLKSLSQALDKKGVRLILRKGKAATILADIAAKSGAGAIHCLNHYEPWWQKAEEELETALPNDCELIRHDGNYLLPPGTATTGSGDPYKIYTPFMKALMDHMPPASPANAPRKIDAPSDWPESDALDDWKLEPAKPDWATEMAKAWAAGEDAARRAVNSFSDKVSDYDDGRNRPSEDLTSRLSPHLHFGEVSPAYVWHRMTAGGRFPETFLKELIWRDYTQNVIYQFPNYGSEYARDRFDDMTWRDFRSSAVRDEFDRWTTGRTGYPIVDAGMRQLWAIGWIHNRVRMLVASFLVKHLLIDWREGEQWFWDCLIDADYGNNSVNWQWISGTGLDSNMVPRIMAPLSQSEKFDAAGYIREWVPELADLDDDQVHDPEAAGCKPDDYPDKIIAHKEARERALNAYSKIKG